MQPSAALGDDDDDDDDGSGDWDIMGSDPEAAIAPRAGHQPPFPREVAAASGRRSVDKAADALNHVPVYDTGEPQYTFGDGGGPPAHSRFFAAVQDLAHAERTSAPVCPRPPLAAHIPKTVWALLVESRTRFGSPPACTTKAVHVRGARRDVGC